MHSIHRRRSEPSHHLKAYLLHPWLKAKHMRIRTRVRGRPQCFCVKVSDRMAAINVWVLPGGVSIWHPLCSLSIRGIAHTVMILPAFVMASTSTPLHHTSRDRGCSAWLPDPAWQPMCLHPVPCPRPVCMVALRSCRHNPFCRCPRRCKHLLHPSRW